MFWGPCTGVVWFFWANIALCWWHQHNAPENEVWEGTVNLETSLSALLWFRLWLLFTVLDLFIYLYLWVFCLHACVCTTCEEVRRKGRIPWTWSCEPPCSSWVQNLDCPQDHQVLLADKSLLLFYVSFCFLSLCSKRIFFCFLKDFTMRCSDLNHGCSPTRSSHLCDLGESLKLFVPVFPTHKMSNLKSLSKY